LFPPTLLEENFFGDGGFRNTAPLSPTIKLGAEKILLIGVKYLAPDQEKEGATGRPTVGHIAGSALNALFMDNLELDMERLHHINEIITALGQGVKTERSEYDFVDCKMLRPSSNISKIAETRAKEGLPNVIQYFLSGLGSQSQSADLASYILFEPQFCGRLVDMGYQDIQTRRQELSDWIQA
jgi:NTE family protein